jgi:hypothetical protein
MTTATLDAKRDIMRGEAAATEGVRKRDRFVVLERER